MTVAQSVPGAQTRAASGAASASASTGAGANMRSKLSLARLPMMPQVLIGLLDVYHRDDVGVGDIADIVRRDAAISAKILAVASSASQHGRRRPANVDQCVSMLGMATLKKIVINESIVQVFRRFARDREFDLRRFWEHSLRSALLARELPRNSHTPTPTRPTSADFCTMSANWRCSPPTPIAICRSSRAARTTMPCVAPSRRTSS